MDILTFANLSSIVYDDWDTVELYVNKYYPEYNFKYFDVENTECFIMYNDKVAIFVFRGTNDIVDVLTDMNIIRTRTNIGLIHQGFYESWLYVRNQIFEYMNLSSHKLFFTGHSLGGALAIIAAWDYYCTFSLDNLEVVTFGSPRVFSHRTAHKINKIFKKKIKRIVNNNDIVTRLPLFFRFRHVGQEYYITSYGKIITHCPISKQIEELFRSIISKKYFDLTTDHYIQNYISVLSSGIYNKI